MMLRKMNSPHMNKAERLQVHYPRLFKSVLFSGLIGAVALGFAGYLLISGMSHGEKTSIELSSMRNGGEPSNTFVSFKGKLLHEDSRGIVESTVGNSTERSTIYTPVIATDADRDQPIYCLVSYSEAAIRQPSLVAGEVELYGTLSKNSLPGVIRDDFGKAYGDKLADQYWVLEYGKQPQTDIELGQIFLVIGLISLGIFFYCFRLARKKINALEG